MNTLEFLTQIPGHAEYSRSSKILLFGYYLRKFKGLAQFGASDLKGCFQDSLLRTPSDLSALLRKLSSGKNSPLIRVGTKGKYGLSIQGLNEVESIIPEGFTSSTSTQYSLAAKGYLRKILARMPDGQRKDFVAEAISCLGIGARRATVIMTWLAVIDHLHDYVLTHKLTDFQSALVRRSDYASRIVIQRKEDFGSIKESIFIEVCRSGNIITADIKKLLDEKLGLRNSCAHPSSITVGEAKVVSFIEDVVDNVFSKYSL